MTELELRKAHLKDPAWLKAREICLEKMNGLEYFDVVHKIVQRITKNGCGVMVFPTRDKSSYYPSKPPIIRLKQHNESNNEMLRKFRTVNLLNLASRHAKNQQA